jgi:FxsC-like protein
MIRQPARQGTFFFLSYARSAPIADSPRIDVDAWVRAVFNDLQAEVNELVGRPPSAASGFFDQQISATSDPEARLSEALGQTQVFVPLYSPGYLTKPWTIRERDAFQRRLETAGVPDPDRHIVPVLWTPIPAWRRDDAVRRSLTIAPDVPEYASNGLRALRMLTVYQQAYRKVLVALADRIVQVAQTEPMTPVVMPPLDLVSHDAAYAIDFVVAVLAASASSSGALGAPDRQRGASVQWRPFGSQQSLPAAEYAARTAERLGLSPRTADLDEALDEVDRYPVAVLVDPWVVAPVQGRRRLAARFRDLPPWVVPLVIADREDPRFRSEGDRLCRVAKDVLESERHETVDLVTTVEEFVAALPRLFTRSRRAFLRHGQVRPPTALGAGEQDRSPQRSHRLDERKDEQ